MAGHLAIKKPKDLDAYDTTGGIFAEVSDSVPQIHNVEHLIKMIEGDPNCVVEARLHNGEGFVELDREGFLESVKQTVKMREGADAFATDGDIAGAGGDLVGRSFVPTLGGPFFKNLYQRDFIQQANAAFYAYNHHPIAHQAVNIIKDFTLGRGFRVDCENKAALALWRAFEDANRLQEQIQQAATELAINGEIAFWALPDNNARITQRPYPGQKIPKALIPRVRLVDATVFWDIVTIPEDVSADGVLYYVWLAPTQWQVFTGLSGSNVPTTKFIFQTIPADQVDHYKVNSFSNEKRGRSDLFSVLGFLKRLTDSVNYQIIALQKQSAFCIDTTIRGSQGDIDNYISDQQSAGTIAPAGSEFVHTDAIERKYLGVEGGRGGVSEAFNWTLSMVASGLGIPISYFGTHLSGGQTRGSAIVATEPVAKRFEMRQQVYERIIKRLWKRCMDWAGIADVDCEVTFPEIITADKTQKLKDIALAKAEGFISQERAANMASKELGVTEFDYEVEKRKIEEERESGDLAFAPLTNPPGMKSAPADEPASALSGQQKNDIKDEGL